MPRQAAFSGNFLILIIASSTFAAYLGNGAALKKGWRIGVTTAIGSTLGSVGFAPVDCSSSLRRMQ